MRGADDPDVRLRAYLIIAAIHKGRLREVRRFEGHRDIVWGVAFASDGRFALSGSWDHTVRLWRLPDKGP